MDRARVGVGDVRFLLAQSGVDVKAATVRSWHHRGHITRTRDGYDPVEVVEYVTGLRWAQQAMAAAES